MSLYNVVSLFSGMCGMDIGFAEQVIVCKESVDDEFIDVVQHDDEIDGFVNLKRLPYKIVFQNDILPIAKDIATWNKWNHNYILKDIKDLLKEGYEFPQGDVVIGGFPCQDFSHSGKRKGFESSRGTLYQSFVQVVEKVKPIVFVAENVNGLLTMPNNPIQTIIADFEQVGYEVKYQLIKCEEYGIPQTRWRVIIMGIRLDKRNLLNDDWNIINNKKHRCCLRKYLQHLQEPGVSTDVAQKMYSKASRLKTGQGQKEVCLNEYVPTMRAEHHGNIEFRRIKDGVNKEENLLERRLTVREAALIQTFPPNCILTNPNKKNPTCSAYKPIGNAVPPLLGYIIANHVHNILTSCSN